MIVEYLIPGGSHVMIVNFWVSNLLRIGPKSDSIKPVKIFFTIIDK